MHERQRGVTAGGSQEVERVAGLQRTSLGDEDGDGDGIVNPTGHLVENVAFL